MGFTVSTPSRIGKEPREPGGGEDQRHKQDQLLPCDLKFGSLAHNFTLALPTVFGNWIYKWLSVFPSVGFIAFVAAPPHRQRKSVYPTTTLINERHWYDRLRGQSLCSAC